jgi:hypothetical protein
MPATAHLHAEVKKEYLKVMYTCILIPFSLQSQTKCNGFIVTITNGLSRIVTNYLGIKCTKPSVTCYTVTYILKHDRY